MGQLLPGDTLRFSVVNRESALKALREQERMLDSLREVPTVSSVVEVSGETVDVVGDNGQIFALDGVVRRFNALVKQGDQYLEDYEVEIKD